MGAGAREGAGRTTAGSSSKFLSPRGAHLVHSTRTIVGPIHADTSVSRLSPVRAPGVADEPVVLASDSILAPAHSHHCKGRQSGTREGHRASSSPAEGVCSRRAHLLQALIAPWAVCR